MELTPTLPPSELRIVLALNRRGQSTAPQISRFLKNELTPSTVQTLLYRLQDKGIVRTTKVETQRFWDIANPEHLESLVEVAARQLLSPFDQDPTMVNALLRILAPAK